jgi:RNA polymerase sigma factor (TIGR02999 family)
MTRALDQATQLTGAAGHGDSDAAEMLMPLVYDELRRIAAACLRQERSGHTLQATALVNEAYLKLVDQDRIVWNGQTHFKAVAARAMGQILTDHARIRDAGKRGGGWRRVALTEAINLLKVREVEVSHITEAIARLKELDQRKGSGVELRFFGGLTSVEIAEALGMSVSTVEADWRVARAWLRRELSTAGDA